MYVFKTYYTLINKQGNIFTDIFLFIRNEKHTYMFFRV